MINSFHKISNPTGLLKVSTLVYLKACLFVFSWVVKHNSPASPFTLYSIPDEDGRHPIVAGSRNGHERRAHLFCIIVSDQTKTVRLD
jgi:hypothetical protein